MSQLSPYSEPIPGSSSVSVPLEAPLQSKIICCFGAKKWTKIIAVIQIFYAITISVVRLIRAVTDNDSTAQQSRVVAPSVEVISQNLRYQTSPPGKLFVVYWYVGAALLFQLVEGFTGIFLGIILLVGAHLSKPRPRPRLLILWLIIRGIETIFYLFVLVSFVIGLFMGGGLPVVFAICFLLILLVIQVSSFFAVYVHCQELVDSHNQVDSGFPFHSVQG